ncbi:MAG TPA: MazG family protein [Nocardioidaceae bacterium]|nr:MazG family protein [Nocardioidaceae bacterium]
MQLTFLVTSPRVAPGLMSWAAWQAVDKAGRVLASDGSAPGVRAVIAAGHRVDVVPEATVGDVLDAAAAEDVVWLADDREATAWPSAIAQRIVETEEAPQVEVLHASYDVPGARLLDLVTVMDRLRTSCPWDREQTHESLVRYLLEEAYETLEAIEAGDYSHLREELGDLLLQVYFHARIASEDPDDPFTIDDVAGGIVDKLVHRHPHVFADVDVADAAEVERNWEALKAAEKGRGSVLDGIPQALPALSLAEKTLGRAERVGVEPPPADSLGDRLLALVVEARANGLDAEQELRAAVRRLADAVRAAEAG